MVNVVDRAKEKKFAGVRLLQAAYNSITIAFASLLHTAGGLACIVGKSMRGLIYHRI